MFFFSYQTNLIEYSHHKLQYFNEEKKYEFDSIIIVYLKNKVYETRINIVHQSYVLFKPSLKKTCYCCIEAANILISMFVSTHLARTFFMLNSTEHEISTAHKN